MFRFHHVVLGAGVILALAAALAPQPPPTPIPLSKAPPDLAPAVARAETVFGTLRQELQRELTSGLRKGGYSGAIEVCHEVAAEVTHDVGREQGIAVGRTGDRLRNPTNAPKPWAAPVVSRYAGARADQVSGFVVDLGDRVGVLLPIAADPICLGCHGAEDGLGAGVKAALKERYPADRAVGFKAGDLRGWMWAEVPK